MPENPTSTNRLGEFANAFRVFDLPGTHCFLDFLVYSARENHARVVSRVFVAKRLLPKLLRQIDETLDQISPSGHQGLPPNTLLN